MVCFNLKSITPEGINSTWLQEEMLNDKLEGSSTTKQRKQSIFVTHWNEIGRPTLDRTIKNAIKRKYEVDKWMQPHLEAAKIFTNPYIDRVSEIIKPHVEKADIHIKPYSTKIIHYYKMIVTNVEVYHSLVHKSLRTCNTKQLRIYETSCERRTY
ncbi:hypothetical protein ABFX02_10G073300 [Erythranthe guttata]